MEEIKNVRIGIRIKDFTLGIEFPNERQLKEIPLTHFLEKCENAIELESLLRRQHNRSFKCLPGKMVNDVCEKCFEKYKETQNMNVVEATLFLKDPLENLPDLVSKTSLPSLNSLPTIATKKATPVISTDLQHKTDLSYKPTNGMSSEVENDFGAEDSFLAELENDLLLSEDLNKQDEKRIQEAKDLMNLGFEKNQKKPGDQDYKYDQRANFEQEEEFFDWDE